MLLLITTYIAHFCYILVTKLASDLRKSIFFVAVQVLLNHITFVNVLGLA